MYFASYILLFDPVNGAKRAKFKARWSVKNTKSAFLRPVVPLGCRNFINRLPGWVAKQNNVKQVLCGPYTACKLHIRIFRKFSFF